MNRLLNIIARSRSSFLVMTFVVMVTLLPPAKCEAQEQKELDIRAAVEQLTGKGDKQKRAIPFANDHATENGLQQAREARDQRDWGKLSAILLEILDNSATVLVRQGEDVETFRQARDIVRELLIDAGPEARQAFQDLCDAELETRLKQLRADHDLVALRQFALTYRNTTQADSVLELMASIEMQRGEFGEAAALCRKRIEETPDPAQILRNQPHLAAAYLSMVSDFPDIAQLFRDTHAQVLQELVTSGRLKLESLPQAANAQLANAVELPLAVVPLWEDHFELGAAAAQELPLALEDLAEHGLNPSPTWSGCRTFSNWIVSHPAGISALDPATGQQRWFLPSEWNSAKTYARQEDNSHEDPLQTRLYRWELLMRMHGETTFNHLETDGQRIFSIVPEHPAALFQIPAFGQKEVFPTQSLVCRSAQTGEQIWTSQGGQFAPVFFAGPPVRDGHLLNVLIESGSDHRFYLLSLDAETGMIEQLTSLFEPAIQVTQDLQRTNRAALAVPQGNLLLCATCAGGLIGVDRSSHEFRWAYQFDRDDIPQRRRPVFESGSTQIQYQNWKGWRDVQFVSASANRCLFVSPESAMIHCLNPLDGTVYWTRKITRGRQIIGIRGNAVFVLGDRSIEQLSLESGKVEKSQPAPVPGGRGTLAGSTFLYPTDRGGMVQFDLERGQFKLTSAFAGQDVRRSAPTVLLNSAGEILALSHASIRRLAPLGRVEPAIANDDSFESLERQTRLKVQQGELSAAIEPLIVRLSDPQVAGLLCELLLDWQTHGNSVVVPVELVAKFEEHASLEQKLHWYRLRLEQQLAAQDWQQAAQTSIQLWGLPLAEHQFISADGLGRCRLDRWVQGLWQHSLEKLDAPNRSTVLALVQSHIESLLQGQHVTSAELAERLGQLPWGQRLRVRERPVWSNEGEYALIELRLLEQEDVADQSLQQQTQLRLVELYENRQEATRWYQKFLAGRAKLTAAGEVDPLTEFRDLIDRWDMRLAATDTRELFPGWGINAPQINVKDRRSSDIRFNGIPVEAARGTLPERINFAIDWPGGQGLQFSNSTLGRPWKAYSPSAGRMLRADVAFARAWGLGQQSLVRIGTELFGLSPVTTQGERRATIFWPQRGQAPVDTLGDRSLIMLTMYEELPENHIGFPFAGKRLIDDYEHYVGAVGPVHPGYCCIQQKGMLAALDPAAGHELWRRYELPELADTLGDERRMLLWGRHDSQGKVIRSVDGSLMGTIALPHGLNDRFFTRGPCVLLGQGVHDRIDNVDPSTDAADNQESQPESAELQDQQPVQFTWRNVLDERDVWTRSWPAGAVPFEIDQECFGVLTLQGELEIVDFQAGKTLTSHVVPRPLELRKIVCSVGERTLLIAVSGEITDPKLQGVRQVHDGYRRELINGHLLCLDRQSGNKVWERTLENSTFTIDQPADLPVFVLTTSLRSTNENTNASRMEIYDRRTGEELYRDEVDFPRWTFYAVAGDLKSRLIQVKSQNLLIELDYSLSADSPQ